MLCLNIRVALYLPPNLFAKTIFAALEGKNLSLVKALMNKIYKMT